MSILRELKRACEDRINDERQYALGKLAEKIIDEAIPKDWAPRWGEWDGYPIFKTVGDMILFCAEHHINGDIFWEIITSMKDEGLLMQVGKPIALTREGVKAFSSSALGIKSPRLD